MGWKILVLCTGNSCRSQMAEGFLKYYLGDRAAVQSAGIEAHGLNPRAVQVMQEVGIDIRNQASKTIDDLVHHNFDYILTVCDHAYENCPYMPGKAERLHQDFPDPAKGEGTEAEILQAFRETRDQIQAYVENWANTLLSEQGKT